ncbi:MAG: sn-glycerol-1-phosphate dehydrogenase [Oscillospiraceae bacterium]|nr:sn-glycerol-1-phosphate dehydrogenase [Oscillospiraceae bacterium]
MKNYLLETGCACGKNHTVAVDDVVVGSGVIRRIPEFVAKYRSERPFLLADRNTYKAAGEAVAAILQENGIAFSTYIFRQEELEPNEEAVGSAFMHFDNRCDLIIGIGSGVINDIGKILSNVSGRKYIIVGTAPSMDGYASPTSSMAMDGLKVSLNSRCADVIIGDTDILKQAPEHMLKSGLGDMLAKYISIAEWRIGNLITGEYYCEEVAQLIRGALKKCVDNADGLLKRDENAIEAVFEGLVLGGVAMAYAGVSRPASGVEHYFSHVWDMRGLEFGTQVDLHGIQCAMGTMKAVELYEAVKRIVPDKDKACAAVAAFDYADWSSQLRSFLGKSGETMIAQEKKERKYDKSTHPARFQKIAGNWETILRIIEEELPSAKRMAEILDIIGISRDLNTIGVDSACAKMTFKATKDVRNKYVLSHLAWDLGILDELCALL